MILNKCNITLMINLRLIPLYDVTFISHIVGKMLLLWLPWQPKGGFILLYQVQKLKLPGSFRKTPMTPFGGNIPRYVRSGSWCWYHRNLSLRRTALKSADLHFGLYFFNLACFACVVDQNIFRVPQIYGLHKMRPFYWYGPRRPYMDMAWAWILVFVVVQYNDTPIERGRTDISKSGIILSIRVGLLLNKNSLEKV